MNDPSKRFYILIIDKGGNPVGGPDIGEVNQHAEEGPCGAPSAGFPVVGFGDFIVQS